MIMKPLPHCFKNTFVLGSLLLCGITSSWAAEWTNPAGGAFDVGANWKEGQAPATGANIVFNADGSSPYTVNFGVDTGIGALQNREGNAVTLDLGTHQLSVGSAISNTASLRFNNGTVNTTSALDSTETDSLVVVENVVFSQGSHVRIGSNSTTGTHVSNSRLLIQSGSKFTVQGSGVVNIGHVQSSASNATSNKNSVQVSGAGSELHVGTGAINVGNSSYANENRLHVSGGALLTSGGAANVGANGGISHDNQLLLEGSGTSATIGGATTVGRTHADNSNNAIVVRDGAALKLTGDLLVRGVGGSGNHILVEEGTLELEGASNTISNGYITVDGGSLTAENLTLTTDNSALNLISGFVLIKESLTVEAGRFAFDFSSSANPIGIDGSFDVIAADAGSVYIDIMGLSTSGATSYTLFTFASATGLDKLALGNVPAEMADWRLVFTDNSVQVVVPESSTVSLVLVGTSALIAMAAGAVRRRRRGSR